MAQSRQRHKQISVVKLNIAIYRRRFASETLKNLVYACGIVFSESTKSLLARRCNSRSLRDTDWLLSIRATLIKAFCYAVNRSVYLTNELSTNSVNP